MRLWIVTAGLAAALACGCQRRDVRPGEYKTLAEDPGRDTSKARQENARAIEHIAKGDLDAAEKELAGAAGSGDADGNTAAAAGFLASLAGKYDVAQAQLEQAIRSDTGVKTQAQTRLGLLLLAQGKAAEAAPYLAAAAERDKRNAMTQFFNAIALEAEGNVLEALTVLEAVSKMKDPLAGDAAVRASNLYLAQGNYEKARECISRAETASVNTAAFHTTRGRVFLAAGEAERAAESFEKARQVDANYPAAYLESGLLYIRQQEFGTAIERLQKYVELARAGNGGGRVEEVAALLEQLKQAATAPARPVESAGAVAGRSM